MRTRLGWRVPRLSRSNSSFGSGEFWRQVRSVPLRGLQHRLADQLLTNLRHAWLREASVEEAARLGTHSGWSAGAAILRCPTERLLRLSDSDLRIAVRERLGVARAGPGQCLRVFQRSGNTCYCDLPDGWHAHCCPGLSGVRTACRHNPLVREWAHILSMAGRVVSVEQRDPTMGPNSRLDVVEFPSDFGGPASHDVSVHTVFRADPAFVGKPSRQGTPHRKARRGS